MLITGCFCRHSILSRDRPGQTSRVIDLATDLWTATVRKTYALTSPRGIPFYKSALPPIDTSSQDTAREALRRQQDSDSDSSPQTEKADGNVNPDNKPVATNKYKIKFPSGRTFLYTVNDSGALTKKEVNDYIPLINEMPTHHLHHLDAVHKQASADAKSDKPVVQNKAFIAKPGKGFAGIAITTFTDGTITVRPQTTPPADADQNTTPEQKRRLLQLAIKHLKSEKPDQQAAATPKKGDSTIIDFHSDNLCTTFLAKCRLPAATS